MTKLELELEPLGPVSCPAWVPREGGELAAFLGVVSLQAVSSFPWTPC